MIDNLLKIGQWLAVGQPCIPPDGTEMTRWCMAQNIICFVMRIITILLIYFLMHDLLGGGVLSPLLGGLLALGIR